MKIAVLANDFQKQEWLQKPSAATIYWANEIDDFVTQDADAFFDLQFVPLSARIDALKKISDDKAIIIHFVEGTLKELPKNFVRINAWPGFLKNELLEAAATNEETRTTVTLIIQYLEKKIVWLPDTPGFVSARIIANIINEAYLALEELVSSREEIDIAMKMGTRYPYGPFEWANIIGYDNILKLLIRLHEINPRYKPADFLIKEANN